MKSLALYVLLVFNFLNAYAQQSSSKNSSKVSTTVTGVVLDKDDGIGLPYAYIIVDSTAIGTATNGDGRFKLTIPSKYNNSNITISYLGYSDIKISVLDFIKRNEGEFQMNTDVTSLDAVVLTEREKLPSAKWLLRKVLKQITSNYHTSPRQIDGYYRETTKENGINIRFSDAVFEYVSMPHTDKKYRWKDYQYPYDYSLSTGSFNFDFNSLHRIHFHHKTLKDEKVRIIDSRSSSNLSNTGFKSNIEGGPLGLFARDRVKYRQSFLGKKARRDFHYKVSEEIDENGEWVYVLDFYTKTTKEKLDALESKTNRRQWNRANKRKLLKGKIYIDKTDFAILRYECSVPNDLKKYFCGYTDNMVKHFDYKLDVRYKKIDGKYYLDRMMHEDEFILRDSVTQETSFYAAISEFKATGIKKDSVVEISPQDNFSNTGSSQLYEYALDYDDEFWEKYTRENPIASIDFNIRKDMETDKVLEVQFRDKHIRNDSLLPPVAKVEPSSFKIHGETYIDNYAWLKDTKAPRNNRPVMDYLSLENEYAQNYNIPLRKAQRNIYKELLLSVEKNTTSLPVKENGYFYYSKYSEDDEYPIYYRKKQEGNSKEEILMNVNELAKGKDYYSASIGNPSPNNNLMSVYENTTGKDQSVLKIKDLQNNLYFNDSIQNAGSMIWLDDRQFLYVQVEKGTLRSSKIMRHVLGTDVKDDVVVYKETDPKFNVSIGRSKSKEYIFMVAASSTSSEYYFLKMDNPEGEFVLIRPREKDHSYGVAHYKDQFFIMTNKDAENYKVVTIDIDQVGKKEWKEFIPHQDEVLLQNIELFDDYIVLSELEKAQSRIKIINRTTDKSHYIKFKEDIYNIGVGYNPEFKTDSLQFSYSSFETPLTVYRYHMSDKGKRVVKKRKKPLTSRYAMYVVERKWVTAADGAQIPLTLIRQKWNRNNGFNNKLYLTSYGAYGSGQSVSNGPFVYHLVNAGYVYAIAHVRGGNDMGMKWYEDGKMFNKKNTFSDFIACADYLIEEKYTATGSIVASGGSAGGLLMGAVVNERPELFNTVIFDVPFVDVINTMLDESLPLTVGEFEEWGNPKEKKSFEYIKSYSPYDNVKPQHYPNMLFFTGLNDTRVGYWEPAKMVAKLRATKTDDNLLLLKTSFHSGHSGGSGRYAGFMEAAYKLSLIHDLFRLSKRIQKE